MDRRTFVKNTALSSGALLASSGLYSWGNISQADKKTMYCLRQDCRLPVIAEVDVVIAGATAAGIGAALGAAGAGKSVFLVTGYPYLGEDICGTFQLWNDASGSSSELARRLWDKGVFRTPLQIKRTLDEALISHGVQFLFNSLPSSILWDENNHPAGIVIANRSGEQVVKAKVIIDASLTAIIARLAGCSLREEKEKIVEVNYVVVSDSFKEIPGLKATPLPAIEHKNKKYFATNYALTVSWKDDLLAFLSETEQMLRDKTWHPGQVDSSDVLRFIPPVCIQSKSPSVFTSPEKVSMAAFIPEGTERIFVTGPYSDFTRSSIASMLNPVTMMETGEKAGREAAAMAEQIKEFPVPLFVKQEEKKNMLRWVPMQYSYYTRPTYLKGYFSFRGETIPVLDTYEVVVAGGGTAGAPAAIGAARRGTKTLLIEHLHMLGGTGTAGVITTYFHGYLKGFTTEVDKGVYDLGGDHPRKPVQKNDDGSTPNRWVKDWKAEWLRKECRKAGVTIWHDAIVCGTVVEKEKNTVKGVVVITAAGKGIVLAHTVIDATGSADVAIAAGAAYSYTDTCLAVQGAGLPGIDPGQDYVNTDWTFIDDTDVIDAWRTFVVAKNKFKDSFDLGKLLQTRERRRIAGEVEISVTDIYNDRTYPDTFSLHLSSFDTHGYTVDPLFFIKSPTDAGTEVLARVPCRALLPKGIDGIIVTGLGVSAHRDAMPVIRMQACLQNQGYSAGIWASMAAKQKKSVRNINIKSLQQELIKAGNLPASVLNEKDNYPPSDKQIEEAAEAVVKGYEKLEVLFWDKKRSLPVLQKKYRQASLPADKLTYAIILGLLGNDEGWQDIAQALMQTNEWDKGWNYRGMGQFGPSMSPIDGMIIALGNSKKPEALPAILHMARKLTTDSEFSHFRAVAVACQTIGSKEAVPVLSSLLHMPGMSGYAVTTIEEARFFTPANPVDTTTRNHCLKEIVLAEALFRCGDDNGPGRQILECYASDLCGHYARYAAWVLGKL